MAFLSYTVTVDADNILHSQIETHKSSFAEALIALRKVRDEVDCQISEREKCPMYRRASHG